MAAGNDQSLALAAEGSLSSKAQRNRTSIDCRRRAGSGAEGSQKAVWKVCFAKASGSADPCMSAQRWSYLHRASAVRSCDRALSDRGLPSVYRPEPKVWARSGGKSVGRRVRAGDGLTYCVKTNISSRFILG